MDNNHSQNLIKEYQYWAVYVHENQEYLGRCVVWCKRQDALDFADVTVEEQAELFKVLTDVRKAVKKCFQPDWLNYTFLGNKTRHLHGHFVPRYEKPRIFEGITFTDQLYGHNYRTNPDFILSEDVIQKIKTSLIAAI